MHADRTQFKRPTSLWRIQPEEPCDQPGHVRHPAWAEIIVYAESTHAAHLVAMQLDAAIQAFSIGNGSPTTRTAIPIRSSYAVEPVEPNATIETCASAFPEIVAATLRKQPPTQNDTPLFTDVVITRETRVSCNGADPQLGHPKVWTPSAKESLAPSPATTARACSSTFRRPAPGSSCRHVATIPKGHSNRDLVCPLECQWSYQ